MEVEAIALGGGLELVRANFEFYRREFAVYAVMRSNRWFKQSYEQMTAMVDGAAEVCWFVTKCGVRVGGTILAGNHIAGLYTQPWADSLEAEILERLHGYVLSTGATEVSIQLTRFEQRLILEPLGYSVTMGDCCMIAPVTTHDFSYPEGLLEIAPTEGWKPEMAELLWHANREAQHPTSNSRPEKAAEEMEVFFRITAENSDIACRNASVLLREVGSGSAVGGATGHLAGMCLTAMHEGLPLIFEVCVHPSWRRKGLASCMMKRAISALVAEHSLIRLFVAEGNPAKGLYDKLGFLAGAPSLAMRYERG